MAVCHSTTSQESHADMLSQDWAHIPLPRSVEVFRRGADLGCVVATLLDPLIDATSVVRDTLGDELYDDCSVEAFTASDRDARNQPFAPQVVAS